MKYWPRFLFFHDELNFFVRRTRDHKCWNPLILELFQSFHCPIDEGSRQYPFKSKLVEFPAQVIRIPSVIGF